MLLHDRDFTVFEVEITPWQRQKSSRSDILLDFELISACAVENSPSRHVGSNAVGALRLRSGAAGCASTRLPV